MRLTTRDIAALRRRGAIVQGEPSRVDPWKRLLVVTFPLRLGCGQNDRETHWYRSSRIRREREAVAVAFAGKRLPPLPACVTVTRVGRRKLDAHDNLPASAKAVCDAIAELYQVDDGDERFEWKYSQRQAGEYMVVVEIEAR